ncbi:MAG TPA: aspartate--tRNA ligase [Nitrospinota bacterium]|nr:aspartate--tRNA ligase [Nitrospinota bacterium]|tara:strand:- start:62334 stop:64115 length:1782 start_codon:yes stop_codon:yes gene_type:complete
MSNLSGFKRTHNCGELRADCIGETVTLVGWVHRVRDHGGLVFVDLRDRYGTTQVALNPQIDSGAHKLAHSVRPEFVLIIRGKLSARPEDTINKKLKTGEIEVYADQAEILNTSKTTPFVIDENEEPSDELKLKYRYLEMRRGPMLSRLVKRHKLYMATRKYLDKNGFLEVETPMLTKSTPEGARDYLVPSRVNNGNFYALPQSPQLFKQILMISGMDKYFQITRCFRDEDLRADRQPEFTQIDMEMSFVDEKDIQDVCEGMVKAIFKSVIDVDLRSPFPTLQYREALEKYGTDCPDLRFGMELSNVSKLARKSDFKVFLDAVSSDGGAVRGMAISGGASFSRKELDDLTTEAIGYGAKGLAWIKLTDGAYQSPIVKFFEPKVLDEIKTSLGAQDGDLMVFVADKIQVGLDVLGTLRVSLGKRLNLIDSSQFKFVWIVNFPLFEYDEEAKRLVALHHPFTSPIFADKDKFESDPLSIRARAYDLVLNGTEIGGGSIRIHEKEIQNKMFAALNITDDEAREKFGFLLEAFEFGAPPHGGIAFGLDRVLAIICGTDSIRDVIAFPKTQKATCLLTDAPSCVDKRQLKELGLKSEIG